MTLTFLSVSSDLCLSIAIKCVCWSIRDLSNPTSDVSSSGTRITRSICSKSMLQTLNVAQGVTVSYLHKTIKCAPLRAH